jgi:heme exporter protein B
MKATHVLTLLKKEALLEFRQKHNLYGLLLYISSTVFVLYLTIGESAGEVWNALFWTIQLFICVNAVAKSFLQEESGRMLYYFSLVSPAEFIIAKSIYNAILMLCMSLLALFLFFVFLGNPLSHPIRFTGTVILGGISISLVFTLMSAIAAKAGQNAALIAIMGFPVILPLLLMLMRLSKTAFSEIFREGALLQLTGLVLALDLLVAVLSVILFPYLWKE